jgi:hypothetical protein
METIVDDQLSTAALELKRIKVAMTSGENRSFTDEELMRLEVECGVTIDGTWLHRGKTSRHGLVTAISIDTGKVLDRHYMCTVCQPC